MLAYRQDSGMARLGLPGTRFTTHRNHTVARIGSVFEVAVHVAGAAQRRPQERQLPPDPGTPP